MRRLAGVGRPQRLGIRDQLKSAALHKLASRRDKLVWEASRTRRSVTPASLASTCCSRVLSIQTLKNWTLDEWRASVANPCELAEGLLHRPKTLDLCFYVGDLGLSPCSDISTCCTARHPERQQLSDLCEREPKFLSAPNESQSARGLCGKQTITRCATRGSWQ